MDLRKLAYFATVAECGSFTKAAAQLHIAQPALSRQIALLEDEFGVQLLSRMGRHVRLTDAGEVLLRHAHEIHRGVERARDEMQSRGRSPRGLVRIGAPPSLSAIVVPALIDTIRDELPDVVLKFREGTSLFLERSIMDAELDLALVAETTSGKGICGDQLATEDIALIGRQALLRKVIDANNAAAADVPLFMTWQVSAMVQPRAREFAMDLSSAIEIDAFLTVKDLVVEGRGITLAPVGVYHQVVASGAVAAIHIPGAIFQRPVVLAASSVRPGGRAVDAVAHILRTDILQLHARGVFAIPRPHPGSQNRASIGRAKSPLQAQGRCRRMRAAE